MKILVALMAITILISCSSKTILTPDKKTKSSLNDKFLGESLNVKLWQERFENRDRDVYKHREKIVKALNLKSGDVVADIGAGTGFFLKYLDLVVAPAGGVYAVELAPKFIEFMRARSKLEKLKTVKIIKGGLDQTNLAFGSVDKIMVCDTYHHFDSPGKMLRNFSRVLKKGGELVIIDFDKVPGVSREWILKNIKKSKEEYIAEVSNYHFVFTHESKIGLEENFMLHFKKR